MHPLYSIQPTMHCTTVSILRLSPSHLQQPVCSLNWLILVVSHHLKQVKSILSGCVQSMTYVLYLYLIVDILCGYIEATSKDISQEVKASSGS